MARPYFEARQPTDRLFRQWTALRSWIIADYRFDRVSDVLVDYSGRAQHGAITAGIWTTTEFGLALEFNGSNTWIDLQKIPDPESGVSGTPFTFEFFFRPNASNPVGLFDTAPNQTRTFRQYPTGKLEWHNSSPEFSLNLTANQWTHVTFCPWFDGPTRKVDYSNNGELIIYTGGTNTFLTWTTLHLGNINNGSAGWFAGDLAMFRIYDRRITAGEIRILNELARTKSRGL